jgi:hypothetical protein
MKKGLFLFTAIAMIAILSLFETNLSVNNYKLMADNQPVVILPPIKIDGMIIIPTSIKKNKLMADNQPVVILPPIKIDGMKTTPVIIRQKSTVKNSENIV